MYREQVLPPPWLFLPGKWICKAAVSSCRSSPTFRGSPGCPGQQVPVPSWALVCFQQYWFRFILGGRCWYCIAPANPLWCQELPRWCT